MVAGGELEESLRVSALWTAKYEEQLQSVLLPVVAGLLQQSAHLCCA